MTEMKRSGIEVGTAKLYILYRRTWLRGSTSGARERKVPADGPNPMDVHRTKILIIQVLITMYLENCISETHQAVNHRKEKIYRFQKKSKK